jgi:hypothetical protein
MIGRGCSSLTVTPRRRVSGGSDEDDDSSAWLKVLSVSDLEHCAAYFCRSSVTEYCTKPLAVQCSDVNGAQIHAINTSHACYIRSLALCVRFWRFRG